MRLHIDGQGQFGERPGFPLDTEVPAAFAVVCGPQEVAETGAIGGHVDLLPAEHRECGYEFLEVVMIDACVEADERAVARYPGHAEFIQETPIGRKVPLELFV